MAGQSYELEVRLPYERAEALCDALAEFTPATGTLEKDGGWVAQAWFEHAPDEAWIEGLIRQVNGGMGVPFTITRLEQQDWIAKSLEGLKPVRIGRFAVHGSHEAGHFPVNCHAITIDAGLAFGTGHHGTTAACLEALGRHLKQARPGNVLDLGTGSGVLAIAAAKSLKTPIAASDIDPVAVEVARANARLNHVAPLVRPLTADGFHNRSLSRQGPFDLILANILAGPLAALAPDIRRHLMPGGAVILSGLLQHQARKVRAAYRQQGMTPGSTIIRDGWVTLTLQG